MSKVYILYDDPYYGAAAIYAVFKERKDAEQRAYELSSSKEIWGPSARDDWRWNYEIVERDLE
jgi:hypothetical protein